MREKFVALGVDAAPMSQADFATYVEREVVLNAVLAEKAGMKPE